MHRFARSFQERLTHLTIASLTTLLVLAVGLWAGPYWWPLGLATVLVLGLWSGLFWGQWIEAWEQVTWVDAPEGPRLQIRRWGQTVDWALADLVAITVRPALLKTRLQTASAWLEISHKLLRFETLLARLRLGRPELFPAPETELTLDSSRTGLVVLAAFGLGTLACGLVLASYQAWLLAPFAAAALVPLVRMGWFLPLRYTIGPGQIVVHYGLRQSLCPAAQVRQIREDAYASGGATFFLLRLDRAGAIPLILDEGQLLQPLRPHASWIRWQLAAPPT